MATITTRSGKGSALTHTELDNNFSNLNSDKVEASGDTITGNLNFQDNAKAQFGTTNDLQIYHDAFNSYVKEAGTGNLLLDSNNAVYITGNDVTAYLATFNVGGASSLFYNGSSKLATTSTGVDVTGTVTADGLNSQAGANATDILSLSGSAAGRTLSVQSYDTTLGGAGFDINASASAGEITLQTNTKDRLRVEANGDIRFYEDTGTTAKFFWDASAESLGIGTTSPLGQLTVSDGTNPLSLDSGTYNEIQSYNRPLLLNRQGNNVGIGTSSPSTELEVASTKPEVRLTDTSNGFYGQLTVDTNHLAFSVDGTEGMRVTSAANVGIGRNATSHRLEVSGELKMTDLGAGEGIDMFNTASSQVGLKFPANNTLSIETASTERMRIDSSGRVGIGTTSPNAELHISDTSSNCVFRIQSASTGQSNIFFDDADASNRGQIRYSHASESMQLSTNNSEAMRITSGGNLLVGKTSTGTTNIGTQISGDGYAAIVGTSNNIPLYLENKATNGNCRISFTNDSHGGASFGLNNGGDVTIFDTAAATTRFSVTDAKVLTASGGLAGIELGGVGTSNRLDDYEEGTFTPAFSATGLSVTYDSQVGKYTKVGNVVYFSIQLGTDAVSGTSATEDLTISGLPFACSGSATSGLTGLSYSTGSDISGAIWLVKVGEQALTLYDAVDTSGGFVQTDSDVLGTGTNANRIYISGHYYTG